MAVVPVLSRIRPALPDAALAIMGFASKLLSLLNLGLSQSSAQIFGGIALSAFSEYTMPAIRSMLSKLVDADERGKAFSFLGVLQVFISSLSYILYKSFFTCICRTCASSSDRSFSPPCIAAHFPSLPD